MATATTSYLDFFLTVFGGALTIGLGGIASVVAPCMLVQRLRIMFPVDESAARMQDSRDTERAHNRHNYFWNAIFSITLSGSAFGYCAASYYFYVDSDSVQTGVLKGATLVIGSSIGIAASAALALLARRWLA